MPLPEPSGEVAVLLEDARKRRAIVRDGRVVSREGSRELADHPEADAMVVAPCQQRRPRGRAERRNVKAVVAQPVVRETRVVRGLNRTAECARIAEARVIDQDQEHIWRPLRRSDVARLIPIRLGVGECAARCARERRAPDRKAGAIDLYIRHESIPLVSRRARVYGTRSFAKTLDPARRASSSPWGEIFGRRLPARWGPRGLPDRGHQDRPNANSGTERERLCGTLGSHGPLRLPRSCSHHWPAPARAHTPRVPLALQRTRAVPHSPTASAQRPRLRDAPKPP